MSKFIKFCQDFYQDEEGLTVVEYVIGAGLLVGGFTVLFDSFSSTLSDKLSSIANGIDDGSTTTGG
ncbi:hypothetical protein MACH09_22240 [Vibrio sp. MACH09]|uniref:Flp family type IVb pilin n=1 Tax=unclassified Vibrio TaxID=2614977 RepID=UPI0014935197|nr:MULTISPECIES: Flp family type IVb pilin [unclassified Vibrio]NOI64855.1 Flp family type IVb pilin [Vibrio sp. 99-8-1]GLO61716.1 hypothetical protein MACH09_22240 [Vibrio sp. MACH09]